MPNWCSNSAIVTGPVAKVKALKESIDERGFLETLNPQPTNLTDSTEVKEGVFPDWYTWRLDNWGTKWEVETDFDYTETGEVAELVVQFESAWAPPLEAYQAFCSDNSDCSITANFLELGCDFGGFWETGVGEEYFEGLLEESRKPVEEQDELFKRLDDELGITELFIGWFEDEEEAY